MRNLLGDVIARAGLTQLRIAAPERLGHVTSMINDGRETPLAGERHLAADDLAGEAVAAIRSGRFDFIVVNIGDADAAGHTGDLGTAIEAVERVDGVLGRIADSVQAAGGALLVTSDHGNCEMMRDPVTGAPHTGHTANDVPVILSAPGHYLFRDGSLADVAPTVLKLLGLAPPEEMTGSALYRGNMEKWDPSQRRGALVTYVD
jgi:2,3-bisphosphoglycerate-independent phosphoglycerate mutase